MELKELQLEAIFQACINLEYEEFKTWYCDSEDYVLKKYRQFQDNFINWYSFADGYRRGCFVSYVNNKYLKEGSK